MSGLLLAAIVLVALAVAFGVGAYLQMHGSLSRIEEKLHLPMAAASVQPPAHVVIVHTGSKPPQIHDAAQAPGAPTVTVVHAPEDAAPTA